MRPAELATSLPDISGFPQMGCDLAKVRALQRCTAHCGWVASGKYWLKWAEGAEINWPAARGCLATGLAGSARPHADPESLGVAGRGWFRHAPAASGEFCLPRVRGSLAQVADPGH